MTEKAVFAWGGFLLLLVAIFFLGRASYGMYEKSRIAADQRMANLKELSDLEARKASLEEQVAKLSTPRGVEEELRNRYQVGKEGEQAVMVVDDKGNAELVSATSTAVKSSTATVGFFGGLWNKLFGN